MRVPPSETVASLAVGATMGSITSDEDNVAAFIDAWKPMVGRLPGHRIEQAGGVASMFGNVPMPFLNFSMLDRRFADLDDLNSALGIARAAAAGCAHGSMLAFCSGWLSQGWEAAFDAAGLGKSMDITGMAADSLLPPRRPLPALEYRLATDVATATDLAVINAHAYGMSGDLVACISNLDLWQDNSFGLVAYVDGRPVTCTATFVIGDMIYVALVATEPDSHGKGYGDAVMRRAIELAQAAAGEKRIWLHATEAGRPVYAAMEFETGATTPIYEFAAA